MARSTTGSGLSTVANREVEQLARTHHAWLVGFLRRRFGADCADDLAQDVFARCLRVGSISNPRALLATLARRAAADHYGERLRSNSAGTVVEPEVGYPPDQLERVLLQQLVGELPPKVREVYLLVRVVGLTYDLHGLRHTRGVELALAGCSDAEGAAMMGHGSSSSFVQYRRQADRIRLSDAAAARLVTSREHAENEKCNSGRHKSATSAS